LISQLLRSVTIKERRYTAMINNYEVPEVVEVGRSEDVILGNSKPLPIFPDSPSEPERESLNDDE